MANVLVVLDVDSTLINEEVIELLADRSGTREEVAQITYRAMCGEIDFRESLDQRVATLAGLSTAVYAEVAEQITLTPGVPELVAGVHEFGGAIGVVSGGFSNVIDPLCERLGLDFWRANLLEERDGVLTGRVLDPVIDAGAKRDALREWAELHGVPLERTIAIGDGANDLLMMAEAGLSIAFDAKPAVREAAHISLDERDLSAVLALLPADAGSAARS